MRERKHTRKVSSVIIVLLFITSLYQLATAGWIQGKAMLAQHLLNHSWNKALNEATKNSSPETYKPWPWADTWPVAKLFVPQHKIEQIVLAGDSGNSLAFGPGYSFASAKPNTSGTTVISAHRDTHFRFLKKIKVNEMIYLQTRDKTVHYQVVDMKIVDSKTFKLWPVRGRHTLVLVTCYPFDSLTSGGSLRYLVYAARVMAPGKV